jgi:hypothetical protein
MTDEELTAAIEGVMRPLDGMTSQQIAHAIFGKRAAHRQRIKGQLAILVAAGKLEQVGNGSEDDPVMFRACHAHIGAVRN